MKGSCYNKHNNTQTEVAIFGIICKVRHTHEVGYVRKV